MPLPGSDLEWMALQVEGLFEHDARGRLVASRDPFDASPPPRFFLGRTRHGTLWRFAASVSDTRAAELARLAAGERTGRPAEDLPERIATLRERLATDAPLTREFHGPAFRFPDELPGEAGTDAPIALTPERAELAADHFAAWQPELAARQPCYAIVKDGRAVALCCCARPLGPVVEAGVDTAPGFRGRGYASRATLAWARAIREREHQPIYSTEWSNRASLGVARRLGLIRFGVDFHLR